MKKISERGIGLESGVVHAICSLIGESINLGIRNTWNDEMKLHAEQFVVASTKYMIAQNEELRSRN